MVGLIRSISARTNGRASALVRIAGHVPRADAAASLLRTAWTNSCVREGVRMKARWSPSLTIASLISYSHCGESGITAMKPSPPVRDLQICMESRARTCSVIMRTLRVMPAAS